MSTPNQPAASAPASAAPTSVASAPAGAAPSSTPSTPAPAPAAKPPAAPKAPEKGSPEEAAKRLNEAARKDAGDTGTPDPKPAEPKDPKPAGSQDPATPAPASAQADSEPGNDLFAHVEKFAKDGQPFKYQVEGKDHEIKSAQQLRTLLAQGHKHGALAREYGDFKRQVAENYGPFDQAVESRKGFENVLTTTFNQPELDDVLSAILEGKATPEIADAIAKGIPLKNPDRIKANILSRQVEGRTQQETEAARVKETDADLQKIADELGYQMQAANPDDVKVYHEVKEIREKHPGMSFFNAFKLHPKYADLIAARESKKAADAAEAARQERAKKQADIHAAAGVPGGGTKTQPITSEKGSAEDAKARLRAANAQRG